MNSSNRPSAPYKVLGSQLKKRRLESNQTIPEVCGSVEIEESHLKSIEAGYERPAEDVLELLINHYKLGDSDAIKLWSLAGYDTEEFDYSPNLDGDPAAFPKNIIMLLSMETKTMYTDSLDIHYDNNGLLLNFKQSLGQNQPMSIAKLGMSYEQAEKVHETLSKVLLRAKYLKGPKALPSRSRKNSNTKKENL